MNEKLLEKKIQTLEERIASVEAKLGQRASASPNPLEDLVRRTKLQAYERRKEILMKTGGSLKGKLPKNPVAWQRKIRKQSQRNFKSKTA